MAFKSQLIAVGVSLLCGAMQSANASILLANVVDVSAFNTFTNGGYGTVLTSDGSSYINSNIPSASLNYQTSFTGANSLGDTQTTDVTASGTAESGAGVLKACSALTIDHPYYNANNPVYVDQSFNIDSNGSPEQI
jgi:hypothetical protein